MADSRFMVLALTAVAALLLGCVGSSVHPTNGLNTSNLSNTTMPTNTTLPNSTSTNSTNVSQNQTQYSPLLTQELCEGARGHWDDCGSACRGAPKGTMCPAYCVQMCMCGGIAGFGCPAGYECGDYLPKGADDAMGICIPTNPQPQ